MSNIIDTIKALGGKAVISGEYVEITLSSPITYDEGGRIETNSTNQALVDFITNQDWYEFTSTTAARLDN